MARVQLALNVAELDSAIAFYRDLFKTEPHKVRDGYANFEVADPPLKLILFENGRGGDLNHLGVEVETTAEVAAETERLAGLGHALDIEDGVVCCHAEQDKAWAKDPSGLRWEVYAITDDDPSPMGELLTLVEEPGAACDIDGDACCAGEAPST
ncbi:MAG: glyoxalase/bleomycin resistance/dioxygenase family protein [Dehalococcoidia bacterium]|nr:glyoxalase/bleomycin resistance/dioxygenase family protein [Dehalococcoidia bacterium]MYI86811.1 glyoxalase/bleomycin resistance/dioxygenase family protein [Dehalococcoidia bacterium]